MNCPVVLMSIFACILTTSLAQNQIGLFDHATDVGPVLHKGNTTYNPGTQSYELSGAGANIWFDKDEFHYAYKKLSGEYILRTRARLVGEGLDPHRKFGWMIRTSLDTSAAMVCATVHGDGLTAIQYRKKNGGNIEEVKSPIRMPDIIQIERRGRSFFLSVAKYGNPFWTVEVPDFDFPDQLYAGLFICAHNADVVEKAIFTNVRIVLPAPEGFQPYRDYIGSHLELMDIATGHREIIYSVPNSIQAPNWTADGKQLIYNSEGHIYNFDIANKTPKILNTDFVIRNNNDHVLSPDGKILGLSSSSGEEEYRSLIYTVNTEGGIPKRITPVGPSYLHGWSPDGKWLTYTGGRNEIYNIYKIRSDGSGSEIQLTHKETLDDGPEYSPDGQFIYFNSTRTGSMEIWRMTPDGSNQEQITDDDFQNWFPHFSPDGKTIIFLSYQSKVDPADHPFYKHVYIRSMPAAGGRIRVIAYLYGGQGSMNVPNWSPDGTRIAFVSNSRLD